MAAELKRVTGQRPVPPFGRWLHQASPGWPWHYHHLKIIRAALGRVESGETNRLMIFLHPRSFKSQMVTVRYPAWLLESDPMTRIIVASYNQSLAESFSHETRRIVTERGIPLDPKRQMVDEWLTAAGGGLKAVGVGGGVTGRGANCFPGETPVLTERGYIPIADLHRMELRPRVVSLDESTGEKGLRAILASRESEAYELVEVTTRSGRRIQCTPDHRLYTRQSGYKEADLLGSDDELLICGVPPLWRAKVEEGSEILSGLLRRTTQADSDVNLRSMRAGIRETGIRTREGVTPRSERDLLQSDLCPGVSGGALGAAATVQALRPSSAEVRSSVRRDPIEQYTREPGYVVPDMSHESPQEEEWSWDPVETVRHLCTNGIKVYDLQVDGSHNFFAGDVLAHNCILIDDVVKSAAEVRSAAYRERVWHWWQSDLRTRLEPHPRDGRPPSVILIMTRWSDDDLAGRILNSEGGDEWEVLRIPALAETQAERDEYNASINRPPGEPEPMGREPGEAMNPERFDAPALLRLQNDMGILPFMALYQQRPTAPGGDMFRREWFEIVPALPPGPYRVVRYWDKAGTADGGAYTAGVRMVAAAGNYYVDHVIMGRWAAAEREEIIRQTAAADFAQFGHEVETVVEQEPGSGGKESAQNTIRSLDGYRVSADRVTGDKVVRAEPLAAQASVGRVKLVAGEWNRDYLDILTAFPGGAVKDPVDASSGAYARLVQAAAVKPQAARPRVEKVRDRFQPR